MYFDFNISSLKEQARFSSDLNLVLFFIYVQVTDARDGQSRTIRQFHFTDWPEQGVPKSGEGFIDFIGQVHKTKEQFGQEGPISVHCRYSFHLSM